MKTLFCMAALAGFTCLLFPIILDEMTARTAISAEPTQPNHDRTELDIPLPQDKVITVTLPEVKITASPRQVDLIAEEEPRLEWKCTGWRKHTQGSGESRLCGNFPVGK